ncbi:hypothetical protein CKO12_00170 [Chromatium okenii]|uniref:hypothetical protein n=1 Tax=Chromatium okenii TaxID=61644 RepID=UPI001903D019|nr:hypothetical protein [Chromatium okenii]MBK1640321.1 hypothetical protein [Chromatium okenii]
MSRLSRFLQAVAGALLLAVVGWGALHQPVAPLELGAGLVVYLLLLWRYPAAWLVILPALLPVLDLTLWTGRLYGGEYDLIVGATLALGLLRGMWRQSSAPPVRGFYLALGVFLAANVVGVILNFYAGAAELAADYGHYYSPFNSLRIVKGVVAAWLLLALFEHERQHQRPVALLLSIGLVLGLLLACLSIVWERLFFTGPFDFSQSYRATGLFSAMHLGGASVDGFLALTLPFIAALFMVARGRVLQSGGLLLFMLALYAFLVTFSRANYLAFAGMVALAIVGDYLIRRGTAARPRQTLKWALIGAVLIAAIAVPIVGGGFVQSRTDLDTRLTHWSRVFDALNDSVVDLLFGKGVGSFPRVFRDAEINQRHQYIPQIDVQHEANNRFVRFSPSDANGSLFLRQRLKTTARGEATLSLRLRSNHTSPDKLLIELCEMNILRAKGECQWIGITLNAAKAGEWAEYGKPIDLNDFGRSLLGFSRPVDMLLLNRGLAGTVDIDDVRLVTQDGTSLFANSDFEAGMDHWLFNSGDHLLWHAKNIFLHVWFETGLIGLAAFVMLLLVSLSRLFDRMLYGDRWALMLLIALSGFLLLGAFDTLIDDPRIAMLFFFLLLIASSPATLQAAPAATAFLPWARLALAGLLIVPALGVVVIAHTSLTHKLPPRELLRLALERGDIDWPWLQSALAAPPLQTLPELEQWPQHGVSELPLRPQTYDAQGRPQPSAMSTFRIPVELRPPRLVSTAAELIAALAQAQAGEQIVVSPGVYRLRGRNLQLGHDGRADAPITLRADQPGTVQLELEMLEGFLIDQPYWVIENLHIRGVCAAHSECEHAFHIVGNARKTVIRNNVIVDFNAPFKINGLPNNGKILTPDDGLIERNTIFNTTPRQTGNPVTLIDLVTADRWVVRANIIADFAKDGGDRISYGAFMKGSSTNGVFERNLVLCYFKQPRTGGLRIALSFGGGGSGSGFCRDDVCDTEHSGGIMRNNVILHCPDDVGIYLNRAADTLLDGNLLVGTYGIDVRFPTSTARLVNNILDGAVRERDGGQATLTNNLISEVCVLGDCTVADWFANPAAGDLRLKNIDAVIRSGQQLDPAALDFCGKQRGNPPDLGPIEFTAGADCLPTLNQ